MRACTYFNIAAGAFLFGLSSFAACGGGQSQASSPSSAEPAASVAPMDNPSTASSASPAAPSASGPSLAAAAPASAAPAPKPDRDMNDIRAVVAGNRDAFRACYDRSLKAHPGIKGTFMLKFVVNPDGSVKSAEADPTKSEIHAPDLEACAIGVLKSLRFPQSKKGMESTVNYPFDFNPKGPPPKTGEGAP
jgi:outer membrane biosynthesis protein TonB